MAYRLPPLIVLLVGFVGLVPLAHASPIDPTWLPGVHDEGDHDDVVLALISAGGLAHDAALRADLFPILVAFLGLAATTSPAAHEYSPAPARAPPIPPSSR